MEKAHHLIAMGASAGGVETYKELLRALPKNIPASILIVLHLSEKSYLAEVLSRYSTIPVKNAENGSPIQPAQIYVAPPNFHMMVEDSAVRLFKGPKENGQRPSINVLFRSAAEVFASKAVGVVLSGMLDDGTAGLIEIKRRGGVTIIQDPNDALYRDMPENALQYVNPDYLLPARKIASVLARVARRKISGNGEAEMADPKPANPRSDVPQIWVPSPFTCPDCGGRIEMKTIGSLLEFKCRTGHMFSEKTLESMQQDHVENGLWSSLRTLEESADLLNSLVKKAKTEKRPSAEFEEKLKRTNMRLKALRECLEIKSVDLERKSKGK